jgi:CspA family cold shock protein
MVKGTVVFFHDEKGFGFIEPEVGDGEDVFFHMEEVGGPDLEEDQKVEFEIESSGNGPRAPNVTRIV